MGHERPATDPAGAWPALFQLAGHPMAVLAAGGRVLQANRAFLAALGLPCLSREAQLEDLVAPADRPRARAALQACLADAASPAAAATAPEGAGDGAVPTGAAAADSTAPAGLLLRRPDGRTAGAWRLAAVAPDGPVLVQILPRPDAAVLPCPGATDAPLAAAETSSAAPGRARCRLHDSPQAGFCFDARSLRIIDANSGACTALGYSAAELQGLNPAALVPGLDLAALVAQLRAGRQPVLRRHTALQRRDGSRHRVEICLQPATQAGAGILATIHDPVGTLAAEADAQRARSQLLTAVAALPDGFVLFDAADRLVLCNDRYREIHAPIRDVIRPGVPFAEILRAGLACGLFPEAAGREEAWLATNLAPPPAQGHELEVGFADGRWMRVVERPTPEGGRVGLRIDITNQVESRRRAEAAEAAARVARAQLLSAVEALPDGFILFDADDRLVLCNDRLRALYPWSSATFLPGARFEDVVRAGLERGAYADALGREEAWLAERMADRRRPEVSGLQRLADGRVLRILDRAMPDGGRVGLRIDITELAEARRQLADVIDGAEAGTFQIDLESGTLTVNDRWAEMLGYSRAALAPLDAARLRTLVHPEDRHRLNWSQADNRDLFATELRLRHRDGRYVWILARSRVTRRGADGRARTISGLCLDISEGKRRERILQAVAATAERVLGGGDWTVERATMLAEIGRAAEVDRSYYFRVLDPPDPADTQARWVARQESEWCREGIAPQIDNPDLQAIDVGGVGLERILARFRFGQPYMLRSIAEMDEAELAVFADQDIEAVLLHPVMAGGRVAGFFGFDQCRGQRNGWTPDAVDALATAAHIAGAALEMEAAHARLREARDRAEAASRTKSQFLATMSHEIRTPLNGVLGIAELLESSVTDPEQQRMVQVIRQSGETLLTLLNDLLDMSRIEAGRLTLEAAVFSPAAILRRLEDIHGLKAREKGLRFETVLEPGSSEPRLGDPHRVQQILHNLLGNAVKFTDTGQVRLRCARGTDGALELEIADTGIGMSEVELARVFESFTQADSSITRRYGGTGLGMSIVRQLVALMHGDIGIESRPGQGTTVRLRLPLPPAPAGPAQPPPLPAAEPDPPAVIGLRVLAADDNAANRFILRSMLTRMGARVTLVEDGRAAVEAAQTGSFELILLDISMPVMDGSAALRALRQDPPPGGLPPVVAITANAMADQVAGYLAEGFAAHVAKPFGQGDLRRMLAAVLQR